jgi:hypothetical protein
MRSRETILGPLLLAVALSGCKPKSEVTGSVTLGGAPFSVSHCSVYEARASGEPSARTSKMVTLYASNTTTTISVSEDQPSARVTLSEGGNVVEVGERCATLTIIGAPLSDSVGVTGSAKVACTGAGRQVSADFTFAKCQGP